MAGVGGALSHFVALITALRVGHRVNACCRDARHASCGATTHDLGTPWISADELKALIDGNHEIAVFDSRLFVEYHSKSIPTAISVPGAELVYRFKTWCRCRARW